MTFRAVQKKYLFLLCSLFLCIIFYSCSYSNKTATRLLHNSENEVYDIVVVPGLPFDGQWSRIMRGRIYWVKYLYDRGIVKNIMFSGSAVYSPYYEGKIMAMYAAAIGIPKEHIFSETNAEHSTENIYYSYYLAKKSGFNKIALASDPFQTRTLRSFCRRRLNNDVALLPMVIDTMKVLEMTMIDNPVIDSASAFEEKFISIKKREGLFKRLRGTLGYNIKKVTE